MERLNLSGNQISIIGDGLNKLISLKILKLNRNRIEDINEIMTLANLLTLTNLSISGNPVMDAGNISEFCIFHIKSLEVFNEIHIEEDAKKKAKSLYSPFLTEQHSPNTEKCYENTTKNFTEITNEMLIKNSCASPKRNSLRKENKDNQTKSKKMEHKNSESEKQEELMATEKLSNRMRRIKKVIQNHCNGNQTEIGDNRQNINKRLELKSLLAKVEEYRKASISLQKEIQELKETIKVKSEHLAVLRKQMTEQSVESYLSDTECFYTQEEKASSAELLDLEKTLGEKEIEQTELMKKIENTTRDITKIEREIAEENPKGKSLVSQSMLEKKSTPRFNKDSNITIRSEKDLDKAIL